MAYPSIGQYGTYGQFVPNQYQMQPNAQQPVHGFVYVTGLEGAKAYPMPPNSEMPLFDSNGDVLYIKTTDGAGYPTITVCDCKRREPVNVGNQTAEYVTKDEFERTIEQLREALHGTVPATTEHKG